MSRAHETYSEIYYGALAGFRRACATDLTILLYHGVTNAKSRGIENYSGKHQQLDAFVGHLRYLKDNCNVLSLDDIVELHANGEPYPKNSVAITFDDGFSNNSELAAPALDDFDMPATFYVASGVINTNLMFWVDALEDCLNRTVATEIRVPLGKAADRSYDVSTHDGRLAALEDIKGICKRLPVTEKDRVLAIIEEQTAITAEVGETENYKKMTWADVCALDSHDQFIVGGHSLYHDILALQDPEQAALDITTSIDLLAYHTKRAQTHYSYPEGQPHHFSDGNIDTLKDKGIVCSPSAIPGLNPVGTDLFQLRRIMVGFYGLPLPFTDPRVNE